MLAAVVDVAAVGLLVVDVLEVAGPRPKINEVAFKPSTRTINVIITAIAEKDREREKEHELKARARNCTKSAIIVPQRFFSLRNHVMSSMNDSLKLDQREI